MLTTLQHLLDADIRKFTAAEIQLKGKLPEWIQVATSLKLKAILEKYLDFVTRHIETADNFLMEEKVSSLSLPSRIMEALTRETDEKLMNCADAAIRDACLITCIQTINHFKISAYGTAAAFANTLGMEKAAKIFHEAEINEKHIDDRLSQLAEHEINEHARTSIFLPR